MSRFNLSNKKSGKGKKNKGYPTLNWGPTAINELIRRIPVFNKPSMRVRLPYYDYQLFRTTTAGAIGTYFFVANGVFDPDFTGTGHQPMGFDTLMLYYEQYTVVRSKISVTAINNGANAIRFAVSLTPDTTAPVIGNLVENGEIKMTVLDAPAYNTGAGNGGGKYGRTDTINLSCDCAKYFGRLGNDRQILNDPTCAGTAAANPTEGVYFAISVWGGFFTDNIAMNFDVVIEYDVVFWEPRKLAQQLRKMPEGFAVFEEKKFGEPGREKGRLLPCCKHATEGK